MRNSLQGFHTILLSVYFLSHFTEPISSTVITGSSSRFNQFSTFILESQQKIIKQLETEDGKATFCQDKWQKGESVRSISLCHQCLKLIMIKLIPVADGDNRSSI
jgi:hypothetical protein